MNGWQGENDGCAAPCGRTGDLTPEYTSAPGTVMLSVAWWASSASLPAAGKLVTSTIILIIFMLWVNSRTWNLPCLQTRKHDGSISNKKKKPQKFHCVMSYVISVHLKHFITAFHKSFADSAWGNYPQFIGAGMSEWGNQRPSPNAQKTNTVHKSNWIFIINFYPLCITWASRMLKPGSAPVNFHGLVKKKKTWHKESWTHNGAKHISEYCIFF